MSTLSEKSDAMAARAIEVLRESGIRDIWESNGAKVNVVGSVAMGLIINHRDIDLHVYSSDITEEKSFAIVSQIAKNPKIGELTCVNGLHTDERCVAWHLTYTANNGEVWKFDIIHIEKDTRYDGFFERMAQRIKGCLTEEMRQTILALKEQTPETEKISGVEYYEAVIDHGIKNRAAFTEWLSERRKNPRKGYWMPE